MRSFLRLMTLAAALPLTSLALTGCSSNEGPTGKMDASMDKDKTGGAMEPAKPGRGSMETGKMDGAMDKGKMDGAPR